MLFRPSVCCCDQLSGNAFCFFRSFSAVKQLSQFNAVSVLSSPLCYVSSQTFCYTIGFVISVIVLAQQLLFTKLNLKTTGTDHAQLTSVSQFVCFQNQKCLDFAYSYLYNVFFVNSCQQIASAFREQAYLVRLFSINFPCSIFVRYIAYSRF